jgi:hypothetical protein
MNTIGSKFDENIENTFKLEKAQENFDKIMELVNKYPIKNPMRIVHQSSEWTTPRYAFPW